MNHANEQDATLDIEKETKKRKLLEDCPHSISCYRRNPHHFKEYNHPHLESYLHNHNIEVFPMEFTQSSDIYKGQIDIIRQMRHINIQMSEQSCSQYLKNETIESSQLMSQHALVAETMKEKLELCKPYNLFFTKIPAAKQTLSGYNCISFPDLICPSLGKLENSLQINFMIDVSWLIEQYEVHNLHRTPLSIVYGYDFPMMEKYIKMQLPNVKHHRITMRDPFGVHHSKIGIYKYEHGVIRVVVSTANLYYEDWNNYNQALWLSPECPKLKESQHDSEGCGPTGFKTEFLNYLKHYKIGILDEWIDLVKRADFTAVRVHFVYSCPGRHFPCKNGSHMYKVADVLGKHCSLPQKTTPESEGPSAWPIIAQSSSIGCFGKSANDWLKPTLLRALTRQKGSFLPQLSNCTLNIVYPTKSNVVQSHFGPQGGGCLPYLKNVNDKQKWLQDYLHVWKADKLGRSRAMPHIKSYVRVSPCLKKLAWCVITSANVSKAAWGGNPQRDASTYIRSYEAGVIFLPAMFEEDYFYLERDPSDDGHCFPLMYDLPLESYKSTDEPWCN